MLNKVKKINITNKVIAMFILLVLIFVSFSPISFAETLRERAKRLEKEIKAAKADQKYIKSEITKNVEAINELQAQIEAKEEEIKKLEKEIESTQEEVDKISKDLKEQEEEYLKQENIVKKRLTFMYEAGQYKTWEILLKSDGLLDFLSNYYMLQEISKLDSEILSESSRNKRKIEILKKELDSKEKVLTEAKNRVERSKIVQSNLMKLKESNVGKLNTKEKNVLAKINRLNALKRDTEREIARQMANYLGNAIYVGGEFAWPVPGCTYISTYYGDGPAQGYYWTSNPKGHQGIDIADSYGTPIVAANGGTVVLSEYYGGYGNCIIIDHGGGYFTLYGHGSRRLVSVGQTVKRGQRIMLMGSTGISTGPHLHFEIVVGSRYYNPDNRVNPLPYITH